MIPRSTVTEALGLPPETDMLPEGDLPIDRFVSRFLAYLQRGEFETETPDAWTGAVMDHLVAFNPRLALTVLKQGAMLDTEGLLVDPLLDLTEAAPDLDLSEAAETLAFAALLDRASTT
jgi:hypothetical protein